MKTTKKTIYFISLLFFTLLLHSGSIPFTRAKQTISESYSPNLNFNKPYLYEVVQFGDSTGWYNFTFGLEGEWKTNPGGQIRINLTDFYNKDINDWGNVFSDPIPWYDIEIYKNNLGTLNNNFTLNNN